MSKYICFLFFFAISFVSGVVTQQPVTRCDNDGALPAKLQTALTACQHDLESLITHGFFHGLADVFQAAKQVEDGEKRKATKTPYPGKQEIAGCMMLCMFRKLKIVDGDEIPTVEGLIKHFGEGVQRRGYFLAMTQAVQQCVTAGKEQPAMGSATYKCVISYKIFDCIRGQIMDYCHGN